MKSWLDRCSAEYSECKVEKSLLPTRVLDLGSPSEREAMIRLVEPVDQLDHYVALSHVWGKSNTFLATRGTFMAKKGGFNLHETPPTFRDAILVTRALGIRYLWIDSLCTIQGDQLDWQIESSKMVDVYSKSYFTIAAGNSKSDTEGFLKPRNQEFATLDVSCFTGDKARLYILSHSPYDLYDEEVSYLDERG